MPPALGFDGMLQLHGLWLWLRYGRLWRRLVAQRERERERERINEFVGLDLLIPLQQKLQLSCQDEMHVAGPAELQLT